MSSGRPADPIEEYLGFRAELRTALRTGTPAALRSCVRSWASPRDSKLFALIAQADQVLVPCIKRMILEEARLADLHDEARLWLIANESAPLRSRTIAPTDGRRTPRPRATAA